MKIGKNRSVQVKIGEYGVKICENMWKYMTLYENIWQHMRICDNVWQYVRIYENTWQYMRIWQTEICGCCSTCSLQRLALLRLSSQFFVQNMEFLVGLGMNYWHWWDRVMSLLDQNFSDQCKPVIHSLERLPDIINGALSHQFLVDGDTITVDSRRRWHDNDVLRVELGEEHLQQDVRDQRHLHGSDSSSYGQGEINSVLPFGQISLVICLSQDSVEVVVFDGDPEKTTAIVMNYFRSRSATPASAKPSRTIWIDQCIRISP